MLCSYVFHLDYIFFSRIWCSTVVWRSSVGDACLPNVEVRDIRGFKLRSQMAACEDHWAYVQLERFSLYIMGLL